MIFSIVILVIAIWLFVKTDRLADAAKVDLLESQKILDEAVAMSTAQVHPKLPVSFWKNAMTMFAEDGKYVTAAIIRDHIAGKEDMEIVDCPKYIFLSTDKERTSIVISSGYES